MKHYDKFNNLVGWLVFAIAAFTYCSTVEPTASFWDCPEFITTGAKLEVGHPPGAPFFMLTANLFSQFAGSPDQVAYMVNIMNALLSAGCILFLFWSITALVRKLIAPVDSEMTTGGMWAILGSGVVGALAYTWSDTFWFSAVEGEVYAYSSLFTALVFWLILKWERRAHDVQSDKWLILIAYLTGLSIGVHLLNLLCIPAIVLVYYYKKQENPTLMGSLWALVASGALVAMVLYGIMPGVVKVGGWFELLFVNTLGMPFNTGVIVYLILLVGVIIWSIYETHAGRSMKRMCWTFVGSVALLGIPFYGYGWMSVAIGAVVLGALVYYLTKVKGKWSVSPRVLNTTLLSFVMILVGYSSYALIVIRSTANPPMDQNSPEDIFTLGEYLGREQYGSRPLFYGQSYASRPKVVEKNGTYMYDTQKSGEVYQRKEKERADEPDSYEKVRDKLDYVYEQNMLFPRMHSAKHAEAYDNWLGGIKGREVTYNEAGRPVTVKVPTQWDNIKFFFVYQVNYMYWRYFMWNFVGRQNDIAAQGEVEHGNWVTGFSFIDNFLVGNTELMPTELKNNKAYNVFYGLPLILGIIGLIWQANKTVKRKNSFGEEVEESVGVSQFWVVFFLFFMTGLAIVLYLNQTPQQPRERDYAYAGSFYAYAIWIGMSVAAIYDVLSKKYRMNEVMAGAVATLVCALVPLQMVSQTWDDHDRSGRYTCRDFGQNYLNTLPEGKAPILFTNGDNDTFPLWYNQDVEGVRTDARVCNLSYLQTDWYIDQMKRPAYDSPSLPINWERIDYVAGHNEIISVDPEALPSVEEYLATRPEVLKKQFGENPYELNNIFKYWVRTPSNSDYHIFPTDRPVLKVDADAVRRSGMLIPTDSIPEYMEIPLRNVSSLDKSNLMMLELLKNTNWERPLYVATTVGSDSYLGITDNFILEGLAYRITPFNSNKTGVTMDVEKMYDNLMNKYKFGGVDKKGIYLEETNLGMCNTHRRLFVQLAEALVKQGDKKRAAEVLAYAEKVLPAYNIPYDYIMGSCHTMAQIYAQLGNAKKATEVLTAMGDNSVEYLTWYLSMGDNRLSHVLDNVRKHLYILNSVSEELMKVEEMDTTAPELSKRYEQRLNELLKIFEMKMK